MALAKTKDSKIMMTVMIMLPWTNLRVTWEAGGLRHHQTSINYPLARRAPGIPESERVNELVEEPIPALASADQRTVGDHLN